MRDDYVKKENKVLVIVSVIFAAALIIIAATFLIHNILKIATKNRDGDSAVQNEVQEEEPSDSLRVGDSVKYIPEIGSYTWLGRYSDNTEDVTITNSSPDFEVTSWKILNIKDDGTVDIVSSKQTNGVVYLGNYNGYNNGVKLLNDLCKELYSNSQKGAVGRSIALEDIERTLTQTAKKVIEKYSNGYAEYNKVEETPYTENTLYPNIYQYEKYSKIDGNIKYNGLKLSEQDKFYEGATKAESLQPTQTFWSQNHNFMLRAFEGNNTGAMNKLYNLILPNAENTYYWIATRSIQIYSGVCWYGIRYIAEGGVNAHWLLSSNTDEAHASYYIRPVVNIKKSLLKQTDTGWEVK